VTNEEIDAELARVASCAAVHVIGRVGLEVAEKLAAEVRRLREENDQYAEVIQHGKRLPDANLSQDVAFAAFKLAGMEEEIKRLHELRGAIIAKAERQEEFAGPEYTQNSDADRKAFQHAAKMLRDLVSKPA
jgi:hypothetical protein